MKKLNTYRAGLVLLAVGASMLFGSIQSYARDVSFVWTANPEPVTGYKLYYKAGTDTAPPYTGSGLTEGDAPIVLGNVTSYTVTGLAPTETYHFVLTAFNGTEESQYSAVVSVQPGVSPKIIKITKKS